MERELLFREVHTLDYLTENGTNSEVSIPEKIRSFIKETTYTFPKQLIELLASKEKRENLLTDVVFFERYPQRNKRKLSKNEKKLIAEWFSIRNNIVRPILNYLYGKPSDITKLGSKELLEDIFRHTESWIDAYIIAVDNFKFVTEQSTQAELNELKGVSGKFLFEIAREGIDILSDFAGDVPILGNIIKSVKAVGSIGALLIKYKERQEQYRLLKNKNELIDFVISEKEFFSNFKLTLNAHFRELVDLFVPMMSKDKFIRLRFEEVYKKSQKVSDTNQNEIFRRVCEKWIQLFAAHQLILVFNKEIKIISLKIEGVPFGEQILSKLTNATAGLNLQLFKVNRKIIFYPLSVQEPKGFSDKNSELRYEVTRYANGNSSTLEMKGFWASQLNTPESYNKAVKLSLDPLPVYKAL